MQNLDRQSVARILSGLLAVVVACALGLFLERAHAQSNIEGSRAAPGVLTDMGLVRRYQASITPEALSSSLYLLASDLFEGREAATRGQKLAAQYLASQYRRIGLAPKGSASSADTRSPTAYFQPFKLYKRDAKRAQLEVSVDGKSVTNTTFSQEAQDDLAYFSLGKLVNSKASGVVFAGYGIADDTLRYNDYAALKEQNISVDGKWVVMLADEPLEDSTTSGLPTRDGKPSQWTTAFFKKRMALWQAGRPAGVLIIGDATPRAPEGGFTAAARTASQNAQRGALGVSLYQDSPSTFPSTYIISSKLADKIFSGSGHTVKELTEQINKSLKPTVFEIKEAEINSKIEPFEPLETENVLAYLEGSDPKLKDEVVVVSAHYDHLGINPQAKGDQIYNGAADDGSGTVATLAMAEAFMQAKREGRGPRRSILFINPSAEEKGLAGSAYYVDSQPIVPIERIVANINMDGVGGTDEAHAKTNPNYIYIIGSKEMSEELIEINRESNEQTGTKLQLDESQNTGSDHFNFQKLFVPYLYYSTGFTEHYHQPSDEAATIDYEHLARVVRLAFATAWQVANRDQPPARISRDRLVMAGYKCRPCPLECDTLTFKEPGVCPVCDMTLYPKYEARK